MTIEARTPPRWIFYLVWVAFTAISIPIAAFLGSTLVLLLNRLVGLTMQVGGHTRITEDYLGPYLLVIGLGLVLGLLQYLLLRRYLARIKWWIAATTLGLLLGLLASHLISPALQGSLGRMWLGILSTALLGASLGLLQWLAPRHYVPHAALWILSNMLGWAVVGWGAMNLSNQMVLPAIAFLLVPGIATSIALWLLLDHLPRRGRSVANTAA